MYPRPYGRGFTQRTSINGFRNYTIGGNDPSIDGDSGGIVYVPGKGAYGVVSGRVRWGGAIEGMDTIPAAFNRS